MLEEFFLVLVFDLLFAFSVFKVDLAGLLLPLDDRIADVGLFDVLSEGVRVDVGGLVLFLVLHQHPVVLHKWMDTFL